MGKGLVSNETAVLRRWRLETNVGLSTKGKLATVKRYKHTTYTSFIRSDEGLKLETSALESLRWPILKPLVYERSKHSQKGKHPSHP